jgi:hypothetical protein
MELKIGSFDMNVSGQFTQKGNAVTGHHDQTQHQKSQSKYEKQFSNGNHLHFPCYLNALHFSLDIDR